MFKFGKPVDVQIAGLLHRSYNLLNKHLQNSSLNK